uniref:Uncharacterized protein n=1 Tax=Arundo donax TaxID=35708 RepID=A0A0A9AZD6_ARUDO
MECASPKKSTPHRSISREGHPLDNLNGFHKTTSTA